MTTRLCVSWASNPRADLKLTPLTIEECALIVGLPSSFKLGDKRAVARRLVGAATPPVLLQTLLAPRCRRVGDAKETGEVEEAAPPAKKARLNSPSVQSLDKWLANK